MSFRLCSYQHEQIVYDSKENEKCPLCDEAKKKLYWKNVAERLVDEACFVMQEEKTSLDARLKIQEIFEKAVDDEL